jgi:hypothetical protein
MPRVASWAPTSLIKGARSRPWVLCSVLASLDFVDVGSSSELSFSASLRLGPISVDPNTQATGVGRALMQAVIGTRVLHNTHDTTRHDTTRHDTTRHDTTRHDTTRHDTTRHYTTRHDTTRHYTTRHDTTRHDTTRHDTTRHDTTRHDTTRHDTTRTNTGWWPNKQTRA